MACDVTVEVYGEGQASINLNGHLLVGTSVDEETGVLTVGYWPDGEQWIELFSVPDPASYAGMLNT